LVERERPSSVGASWFWSRVCCAGSIAPEARAEANALLDAAQADYLAKEYRGAERTLDDLADLAERRSTGSREARDELERQAEALEEWMDELG
jgi:hypothetical protein